jgi:tetratricopeptide (TPR) repeat protein
MMSRVRASLIVRSVCRPELTEALAAAGAQTYPELEVVVVDATGGRHLPVPDRVGPHTVVFVAGKLPRTRPVAANAGLDAASGDYLGFLDDDDTLLPGHVAGLAAALDADPRCALTYCTAREVREDGVVLHVGHARLSALTMIESCHFPPCAALFRRSVLERCRFDESLEAAEDWDFWIQVALVAPFRFVPQETAIYRADRGRSVMTGGAPAASERWRDVVRGKWSSARVALLHQAERKFDAALVHWTRGDRVAALQAAESTLADYPFHVGALNLRGTLRAEAGDFRGARDDFAVAAEAAPDDSASAFNLAQATERLGAAADAALLYRRVLAIDASHPQARTRLAALLSIPPSL